MGNDEKTADLPKELAPTSLERAEAVRERLKVLKITRKGEMQVFLAVLDRLGLFHDPASEKSFTTKKATQLARKAKTGLDQLKILSRTFQVNRGGRIIPVRSTGGRRAEPEILRALQILDRFLSERHPAWSGRTREECLADVLRAATGLSADCRQAVIDQVHVRLQTAKKKTPLDDFDYQWALGREPEGWEPVPLGLTIPLAARPTKAETTVTRKRSKGPREDALNKTVVKALRNVGVRILIDNGKVSLECQRCERVWTPDHLLSAEQAHEIWWRCPEGCNETA